MLVQVKQQKDVISCGFCLIYNFQQICRALEKAINNNKDNNNNVSPADELRLTDILNAIDWDVSIPALRQEIINELQEYILVTQGISSQYTSNSNIQSKDNDATSQSRNRSRRQ